MRSCSPPTPKATPLLPTSNEPGSKSFAVLDARAGETISKAAGSSKHLNSVTLLGGSTVKADLLVTAVGWTAPTSLLNMAGDRPSYSPKAARFFSTALPDNVIATGGIVGDGSLDELIAHGAGSGELAAQRAAAVKHRLRSTVTRAQTPEGPEPPMPEDHRGGLSKAPHPELYRSDTHGMVDFSEDVGSKDLVSAAAEGFDSVELLKRFTTATMGPSQGKLETVNTVAVLAEGTRRVHRGGRNHRMAPRPTPPSASVRWQEGCSNRCGSHRCTSGTPPTT